MNPELTEWSGENGLPRFDLISDDDFAPAFDAALKAAEDALEAIAANPAPADFDNTVAALETAEEDLSRVAAVFYTLAGVNANPQLEAIERDLAPRLAKHNARFGMDERLYARVRAVAEQGSLAPQERRITALALRDFARAGAGLSGADRERMAEIRQRLAVLYNRFSQNVLADERDFALEIAEDRMDGLPDGLRDDMAAAARERGHDGFVLTLSRSLIVPFLKCASDRDLRRTAWRAWAARGTGDGAGGDATDNRAIATEILALRHERARLLGFDDFAAFKLDPEMARNADRVEELLTTVWDKAIKPAEAQAAELTEALHQDGFNDDLQPWDWRYYAEAARRGTDAPGESEIKPYLTLDAMLGALRDVAQRLFGLEFEPLDAPLWHKDALAWRITRDGREMAVFVGDYFARSSKRSGAWCSALQYQHKIDEGQRPIVVNVCNFTPPASDGAPAFLSWDDARTLFHEFGHALHHILSDVDWPSISGTSVARDFVELPSQLFEHWLEQPEVLDAHASHHETGAPMPKALRDQMIAAGRADQAFATMEYLASALVDLHLHRGEPPEDAVEASKAHLRSLGAPQAIPMRHATPHFTHVFAGDGYSAGYYSYLWSEVMDADAFAAFRETGDIFDRETAQRLEDAILSRGGSAPAEELWLAFRERMPGVEPLLEGRGLI
ncbi:MAG: M3 family metallopeptidase [Paracoccus sp. (in: a-proteobacteria)]|nr:M3 family metallopeptidase [Paracoccus sp. (in: a-proteobacteria)]